MKNHLQFFGDTNNIEKNYSSLENSFAEEKRIGRCMRRLPSLVSECIKNTLFLDSLSPLEETW